MSRYVREEEFDYGKEADTVLVSGLVNLGETLLWLNFEIVIQFFFFLISKIVS